MSDTDRLHWIGGVLHAHGPNERPGCEAHMVGLCIVNRQPEDGLREALEEALGEKRPVPRSDIDNGWNDCRDFVLRFLALRSTPAAPLAECPIHWDKPSLACPDCIDAATPATPQSTTLHWQEEGWVAARQPDTAPGSVNLRAVMLTTADWLDGIIAETDPKPSELMAMVAGLRDALAHQPIVVNCGKPRQNTVDWRCVQCGTFVRANTMHPGASPDVR